MKQIALWLGCLWEAMMDYIHYKVPVVLKVFAKLIYLIADDVLWIFTTIGMFVAMNVDDYSKATFLLILTLLLMPTTRITWGKENGRDKNG